MEPFMEPSGQKRPGHRPVEASPRSPYRRAERSFVDTFTSCCPKQADYAAACVGAAPKHRHAPGDADDRTRGTLDALDGVELPHTREPLELSRPAIAERDP